MEVNIGSVGAQQAHDVERNIGAQLENPLLKLSHRHEVGISSIQTHIVFALQLRPDRLLAVKVAAVARLKLRHEILVQDVGSLVAEIYLIKISLLRLYSASLISVRFVVL